MRLHLAQRKEATGRRGGGATRVREGGRRREGHGEGCGVRGLQLVLGLQSLSGQIDSF